jgi:ketosteroid isomerase-like protein
MSEENVDLLQRLWETLMSGDYATLPVSLIDPEVTYEDELLPDHIGETYLGHDGMQRAWDQALEAFEEGTMENQMVWARGIGDQVVSCHHVRRRGRGSGIELEFDYAYLWRMREGKLIHCKAFRDSADALEAAGLSE